MQTENLIAIDVFCSNHNIEISFLNSLESAGMIEIIVFEQLGFVEHQQLPIIEKYIRLYYELDINLEGIEVITYLLEQIKAKQNKIVDLENKLRLYEA